MPDRFSLKVVSDIHRVDAAAWDACAGAGSPTHNPFVTHAFLSALEESGSVSAENGWAPQHLILEEDGRVVGCAPLYLKTHSYGEYIFDWGWAQAYERAGGRYYPKLQCAVPFTPATGPRLLVAENTPQREALQRALAEGMMELARQLKVSSVHVTFATEAEHKLMADEGLMPRLSEQFHWKNEGYASFDDFLAALSSRKRKTIRRERDVANSRVKISTLTGDDITERHWDAFFRFYMNTSDRKWGQAYLNREFFSLLGERLKDAVVLVMGEENGEPVCGALNLRGGDTLFGRNWGTAVDYPMLHFEVCYYRAMDFAIAEKLAWVEAGAQGEHKIQRGYLPRSTYSNHWIADRGFRNAVADFLARERAAVTQQMEELTELGPFKRDGQ
ncbi:MAG: N-acetyltransferase [Rhodospirillaceae bacterium]|nr:N-acetyltransferase [Rhodospirillaceae bacterium]